MSLFLPNLDLSLLQKQKTRDPQLKFPCKLYQMLMDADRLEFTHIVSWHNDGRCFRVHDPTAFVDEVLPKYFKKSKYRSFQRQCNLYGFHRVTAVKPFWDSCYYHPMFTRGDDECCTLLDRPVRTKNSIPKQTPTKHELPLSRPDAHHQTNSPSTLPEKITGEVSYDPIPTHSISGDVDTKMAPVSRYESAKRSSLTDQVEESRLPQPVSTKGVAFEGEAKMKSLPQRFRRSSYQELCQTILGEDCAMCRNGNEELLLESIINQ